jgi:Ca-activated chloride channel family protein
MRTWGLVAIVALVVAGCGGAAPSSAPSSPPPSSSSSPPSTPTAEPSADSSVPPWFGEPSVSGPATVEAGTRFDVVWTGPLANDDYITIVALGATTWNGESYFDATAGSPAQLTAPLAPGAYELWYVNGADATPLTRSPITVLPASATLDAPAEIEAGTSFQVSWTGPNGPGDFITIVAPGTARWTNESYFPTSSGSTGTLTAPLVAGPHQIRYVSGQGEVTIVAAPITVTPTSASLDAPAEVAAGTSFQVSWTGPNGPGDYITIVATGAPPGTYLSYANTSNGSPATLTAPTAPGSYELRYVVERAGVTTLATRPIEVR